MQILTPRWIVPVEPARTVLENHSLVMDGATITGNAIINATAQALAAAAK